MPSLNKKRNRNYLHEKPKEKNSKSWGENTDFYRTKEWRNTRKHFIAVNPLCKMCEEVGIFKEGNVVDHINPISQGGSKFDWDNLQTLCHGHHNQKTNRENDIHR